MAIALALVLACAGCAGGRYATGWDGRRGYDGNGDYGYDVAASRSEARLYLARAARSYPQPGTPDDPWGPYIREAAARFQVPETWIRAVMKQESGGRLYDADGALVISSAGAMGLMQVMPATYDMLRQRYGLGDDPYEPHDNILAGAGYIREMYDHYGSPGFLAAYNAGPRRVDAYLAGTDPLPAETVNYVASIAPRIGAQTAMAGPVAGAAVAGAADPDRAYAGGGMTAAEYAATAARQTESGAGDASDQAFAGGGLVTPEAPTGVFATPAAPRAAMPPVLVQPVAALAVVRGAWAVQVGAFPDPARSQAAIVAARSLAGALVGGAQAAITPVQRGQVLYRARLVGLSSASAMAACARLSAQGMACFTVPPGS